MRNVTIAAILAFGLGTVGVAQAGEGCSYGGHGIKATKVEQPQDETLIKTTTVEPQPAEEPTDEPG